MIRGYDANGSPIVTTWDGDGQAVVTGPWQGVGGGSPALLSPYVQSQVQSPILPSTPNSSNDPSPPSSGHMLPPDGFASAGEWMRSNLISNLSSHGTGRPRDALSHAGAQLEVSLDGEVEVKSFETAAMKQERGIPLPLEGRARRQKRRELLGYDTPLEVWHNA